MPFISYWEKEGRAGGGGATPRATKRNERGDKKTSEKGVSYTSEDARRPRGKGGGMTRDTSCEADHQAELSLAGGPRPPPPPPKPPPPWAALPMRFVMPWRASLPP